MLSGHSNDIAVTVIVTGVAVIPTIFLLDCSSLSGPIQGHPAQTPRLRACPPPCLLSKVKEIQVSNSPLW